MYQKKKEALRNLYKTDHINIITADKGSAVIIDDVDNYVRELNRQLGNKGLTTNATNTYLIKVKKVINELKASCLLDENVAKHLLDPEAIAPNFLMFQKVKKGGNPGFIRKSISMENVSGSSISVIMDVHSL